MACATHIVGVGNDIISILRIAELYEKFGDKFLARIFTEGEIAHAPVHLQKRVCYFAKRFAAKEAAVKALGTGFRYGIAFTDIEVISDDHGKPTLFFSGAAQAILMNLSKNQASHIHLSLSDDRNYATAFVVIEKECDA